MYDPGHTHLFRDTRMPESPTDTAPRLAYTVNEAANLLSIGRTSVYEEVRLGRLRSFRAGGRRLFSREALLEYIAAREAESAHVGAA